EERPGGTAGLWRRRADPCRARRARHGAAHQFAAHFGGAAGLPPERGRPPPDEGDAGVDLDDPMSVRSLQIVEVGPRDGLQNEDVLVATADKVALIERMIEAGARRFEVASFVNPKRVPQMADAEAVIAVLPDRADVSYIGLCLNLKGVERAARTREGNKR